MATTIGTGIDASFADARPAAAKSKGILRSIYAAMIASRQRAAEREIERFIMLHGGLLTDKLERDISRNFGSFSG